MRPFVLISAAILAMFSLSACAKNDNDPKPGIHRQDMRDFVIGISQYAKAQSPGFAVIPQNGIELITENGESDGPVNEAYLNAIDGHGQEDLFYGYHADDEQTPPEDANYLQGFLNVSAGRGKAILVTNYCSSAAKMIDAYTRSSNKNYISFSADHRELDHIPAVPAPVWQENANAIKKLSEARNFLYLLNPSGFSNKQAFIDAVKATNYDAIIMDLFFTNGAAFTKAEVDALRQKANGGRRLVICYMSIGEAEDYRYYWQQYWATTKPAWLDAENPDWPGNYKAKFWMKSWQDIIYGTPDSYLGRILDSGFDGVYLDIIDAFEYYE